MLDVARGSPVENDVYSMPAIVGDGTRNVQCERVCVYIHWTIPPMADD